MSFARRDLRSNLPLCAALVALALVAGVVSAPPLGAQESEATISVTQVNELNSVYVSGSGFIPNLNVTIVQCGPGADEIAECDRTRARTFRVNSEGTFDRWGFAANRHVAAVVGGVPGLIDCLVATCTVLAADSTGHGASAPLDFTRAPNFAASLSVSPDTDLSDSQTVTVEGTGFLANQTGWIYQCGPGGDILGGCDDYRRLLLIGTDDDGSFSASVVVRRDVSVDEGGSPVFRDCAPVGCAIFVGFYWGNLRGYAPLAFTDTPRPPANPTLTATPSPGQPGVFTVTGRGFPQGGEFDIRSCDAAGSCRGTDPVSFMDPVLPDETGAFSLRYEFPRQPSLFRGELDCLIETCTIRALIDRKSFAVTDQVVFPTPDLTINLSPLGTLEAGTNDAVAQATIACDIATPVSVEGSLSQVGIEAGFSFDDQRCTPETPVLAVIPARNVVTQTSDYALGEAQLSVAASPFSEFGQGPAESEEGAISLIDFDAVAEAIEEQLAEPGNTEIRMAIERAIRARVAQDPLFAEVWRNRIIEGM